MYRPAGLRPAAVTWGNKRAAVQMGHCWDHEVDVRLEDSLCTVGVIYHTSSVTLAITHAINCPKVMHPTYAAYTLCKWNIFGYVELTT